MEYFIFLLCCAAGVALHYLIVRPVMCWLGVDDDIRTSRRYLPRVYRFKESR
jgi:hypothetical protein